MGQVITRPRTGDTPPPGTRGARRREDEQQSRDRGSGRWVLAVVVGIALALAIGWFVAARDTDAGTVGTASDEAAALADEKDAILATAAGGAITWQEEATNLQQEKEQLVRDDTSAVRSTGAVDGSLHDEKIELASRRTGASTPQPPEPLTEQAEKEMLLAG